MYGTKKEGVIGTAISAWSGCGADGRSDYGKKASRHEVTNGASKAQHNTALAHGSIDDGRRQTRTATIRERERERERETERRRNRTIATVRL